MGCGHGGRGGGAGAVLGGGAREAEPEWAGPGGGGADWCQVGRSVGAREAERGAYQRGEDGRGARTRSRLPAARTEKTWSVGRPAVLHVAWIRLKEIVAVAPFGGGLQPHL